MLIFKYHFGDMEALDDNSYYEGHDEFQAELIDDETGEVLWSVYANDTGECAEDNLFYRGYAFMKYLPSIIELLSSIDEPVKIVNTAEGIEGAIDLLQEFPIHYKTD